MDTLSAVWTPIAVYVGGPISSRHGVRAIKIACLRACYRNDGSGCPVYVPAPVHVDLSSLRLGRRVEFGGLSTVLEISDSLDEAK